MTMTYSRWLAGWMVSTVGSLLVGSGCSRENPAFMDTDEVTSTSAGPGSGVGDETRGTSESDDPDGTSTTEPTDTDAPSSDSSSGGELVCELHPLAPIDITVLEPNGDPLPLTEACIGVIIRPNGLFDISGGTVRHQICPSCECMPGDALAIELGSTLQPPVDMLPECGKLVVWEGFDPDGECRWDGFAILDDNATVLPTYFAMNSRTFPEPFGPVPPVELDSDAPCEDVPHQCAQTPGCYALGFASGPSVFVDAGGEDVGIGLFADANHHVDNRMAFIDLDCREHVAWTALLNPR